MRSLSSAPRSRVRRRRSSSSGLGARTTDPPLASSPGHRRPQQRLAVDRIGLGPPMPPGDRDRSRIDDVALDPIGDQQAMKPVQFRFLNDDRFDPNAIALLGLRPPPGKKVEQAGAVPAHDGPVLGKLLAARTVDRHNPFQFAQFERGEQRDIIRRAVVATTVAEVTNCIGCLLAGVETQPTKSGRRPTRIGSVNRQVFALTGSVAPRKGSTGEPAIRRLREGAGRAGMEPHGSLPKSQSIRRLAAFRL